MGDTETAENAGGWCKDKLFDYDVSWNTTTPDVSVCLQKTALVLMPFGLLWILFIPRAWLVSQKSWDPIGHTGLNITKTFFAFCLAVLAIFDLVFWSSSEFLVDILDPIVRLLTWLFVIFIIQV